MEEVNIVEINRKKEKRGGEKKEKYVAIGEVKVSIRYRILMASGTEREIEEIEVYCSTLDVTISIFSTVLLFSRAARSLIRAMVSISGKKKKERKRKQDLCLSRIGFFISFSFVFSFPPTLTTLSFSSCHATNAAVKFDDLLAKRRCRSCFQLCNRRTSGDTDRRRRTFCLSLKSIRRSWLIVHGRGRGRCRNGLKR